MESAATILLELQKPDHVLIEPVILYNDNRLLNREVEEFIVKAAESMDNGADIELVLLVLENGNSSEDEIQSAIHQHFHFCMQSSKKQLRNTIKRGWSSLVIAIVFLLTLLFFTRFFVDQIPEDGLMIPLRELLIILGWVALWRPAELLLYEWQPYRRQVKLFERLSRARVKIATR